MTQPEAFNHVFHTKSCVGEECSNACPNVLRDVSDMHNTADKPAAVWKRGQKVMFSWAKNNHRGGLVRVSLVPADSMMSRPWHAKLALFHGCWESGMYRCAGDMCGSDSDNEGFQREVVIPPVFPDGIYVAAVVWYGGLHFSRDKGQFPDYFSCSFVHIKGGAALGGSYQPEWAPGDTGKFEAVAYTGDPSKEGMCHTASDEVGKCPNTGCTGPDFWAVSKPYQNGRMPDKITPGIVADAFKERPVMDVQPDIGRGEPTEAEPVTAPEADPVSAEDVPAFAGAEAGICSGSVCCPTACGQCGGTKCQMRPGGGENCCHSLIKAAGKSCASNGPPCVRE